MTAQIAIWGLLAAAIACVLPPVLGLALASDRLPQWDMAKYGVSGLRLAGEIRNLDLLGFLRQVNALDVWPPVFPLLEAPVFLIFGPGYGSARAFVSVLFVVLVAAAAWAGSQVNGEVGLAAGAITAALIVTSPFYQLFATLVMLEIPGTMLLVLAIGWYLRSLRSGRRRDFSIACLLATALFFCKYNYGVMWLLPMAANETLRTSQPPILLTRVVTFLRRPGPAFVTAWLLLTAAIVVSGPWRFNFAGRVIRIGSAANSIYALYVLVLASWAVWPRHSWRRLQLFIAETGWRTRTMAGLIVLPIALWMVVPAHTVNFVRFMENRSSGPPLLGLESLLFYPHAFITAFSPIPVTGIAALLLALAGLRHLRGDNQVGRVLALALIFSFVALVFHPYKQPRFFFTTAAVLWLVASCEVASGLAYCSRRLRAGPRTLLITGVAAAALVAAAMTPVNRTRLARSHRQHTVPASTRQVVDAIADRAADSRSSVLLGTWNGLSPGLVEWHCLQRRSVIDPSRVPQDLVRRARRGDVVDRLARTPHLEVVMVLSEMAGSDLAATVFGAETAWLDPVRARLARNKAFTPVDATEYPASGYRLTTYRLVTAEKSRREEEGAP